MRQGLRKVSAWSLEVVGMLECEVVIFEDMYLLTGALNSHQRPDSVCGQVTVSISFVRTS